VPLVKVLFTFRQREIGFGGDIAEMFHRVLIRAEDLPSQRFLWRDGDTSRTPDVYEMCAMTFGSTCSPCSAHYVKNRNAKEFMKEFPEAADAVINKHYVDDYFDSTHTEEEGIQRFLEVTEVHRRGGFLIRNWMSNSIKVLEAIPPNLKAKNNETTISNETDRVLGVHWNANADKFTFVINFKKIPASVTDGTKNPTKREMLKVLMSLFDPLGFLNNFVVIGKILMQEVWRVELGWDDELSGSQLEKWKNWIRDLPKIKNIQIPRCYSYYMKNAYRRDLHVFCDASEKAFAAVAYMRIETPAGIEIAFVMSKSTVSPLKPMSIPRLELQAAVLGCRLAVTIKESHDLSIDKIFFWSDSKTVLCWLRSETRQFKQFVAFRVGEILEQTEVDQWNWVPTKENPADDATRDVDADVSSKSRWLTGPDFLRKKEMHWPRELITTTDTPNCDTEIKTQYVLKTTENGDHLPEIRKFSSRRRLLRVTAWVMRFLRNCRKQKQIGALTTEELDAADLLWIKRVQQDLYYDKLTALEKKKQVSNKSSIYSLDPVIDENGVLRLNGRLKNSPHLEEDTKQPIILGAESLYTKLLLDEYHVTANHCGMEFVTNEIRQRYWIPKIRMAIKSTWNRCQHCKNLRSKQLVTKMGNLPHIRVTGRTKPFTQVGLDFFGPLNIKLGHKTEKRYGVIFACMATRAVHLELASSLTTDSCILAIRRMVSRRGFITDIYSDNATNFRGADSELRIALEEMKTNKMSDFLTERQIRWHFNPPGCPHMGGSWERLIRSVKNTLKVILKNLTPNEEMMRTILAESEAIVNSSPLTFVSLDKHDDPALTPTHFLLGCSSPITPAVTQNQKDEPRAVTMKQ